MPASQSYSELHTFTILQHTSPAGIEFQHIESLVLCDHDNLRDDTKYPFNYTLMLCKIYSTFLPALCCYLNLRVDQLIL